jgi:hypothetical protein
MRPLKLKDKIKFKSTGDPDCKRWGFQEKV